MTIHPHLKLTAGTWRIRAVVPADAEHGLSKSGYLKIKVRK